MVSSGTQYSLHKRRDRKNDRNSRGNYQQVKRRNRIIRSSQQRITELSSFGASHLHPNPAFALQIHSEEWKLMKKMNLNHVALVCSSEKNAERFYGEILGLKKIRSFIIPATLTQQIFNIDDKLRVIVYGNREFKVELFLLENKIIKPVFNHICLEVRDPEQLIKKCVERDVMIIKIPKADSFHLFIKDYDNNLFEIKEKL